MPPRAHGRRVCVAPAQADGPGPGSDSLLPDLGFGREEVAEAGDELVALGFVAHLSIGSRS